MTTASTTTSTDSDTQPTTGVRIRTDRIGQIKAVADGRTFVEMHGRVIDAGLAAIDAGWTPGATITVTKS